jgi:hypothetical protein
MVPSLIGRSRDWPVVGSLRVSVLSVIVLASPVGEDVLFVEAENVPAGGKIHQNDPVRTA